MNTKPSQDTFEFAAPRKMANITATPSSGKCLRPGMGVCSGYDFVCNPYIGCSHGCTFCYARAFVAPGPERDTWGDWLKYKEGALSEIKGALGQLAGKSIFLSSATDPYQPAETQLGLTGAILRILAKSVAGQPSLHLITRSPMVLRDISTIQSFRKKVVTISITSDDPAIHKATEPKTASYETRWKLLHTLKAAGIPVGVNLCPLLRLLDAPAMMARLQELDPTHITVDTPHQRGDGKDFVGTTLPEGLQPLLDIGWHPDESPLASAKLRYLLGQDTNPNIHQNFPT